MTTITTPAPSTAPAEVTLPDIGKLTKLLAAVSSLDEAYVSITTSAFRSLCENLSGNASSVLDYYNEVNKATNKGKRNAKPITFEAFYRAVSAACVTVGKPTPERKGTRFAYVFAAHGNTDKMQRKFLAVAGLNADFGVSIEDFIRFLGVEGDYTQAGELTSEAQAQRASAQVERDAADALRKAARKARPIGFDWSGMVPTDLRDPKQVVARQSWLIQLQQDLAVYVNEQAADLTDPKRKAAANKAASAIKAAAK